MSLSDPSSSNVLWHRFSIANALLLTGCLGIGFLLASMQRQDDHGTPDRFERTVYELFILGAAYGLSLAPPLVLLQQFKGGRRAMVSVGEMLWYMPGLHFTCLWCAHWMHYQGVVLPLFIATSQLGLFFGAAALLGHRLDGHRRCPCLWTDGLGAITVIVVTMALLLDFWLHPVTF